MALCFALLSSLCPPEHRTKLTYIDRLAKHKTAVLWLAVIKAIKLEKLIKQEQERQTSINPSVFTRRHCTRAHSMNNTFIHYNGPQQCLQSCRGIGKLWKMPLQKCRWTFVETHWTEMVSSEKWYMTGGIKAEFWVSVWKRLSIFVFCCWQPASQQEQYPVYVRFYTSLKTFTCPQLQFKIVPKLHFQQSFLQSSASYDPHDADLELKKQFLLWIN